VQLVNNPKAQYLAHRSDIEAAIARVLDRGVYILGPEVETFEREFADFCGVSVAIAVANGTDAIRLALRAFGIGEGDEVITVSHTALATVAAIEATGARPVLIDIDPKTYTMRPDLLAGARSDRTRAIVPVHLYGHPADMTAIMAFAAEHKIYVIEDCAQAHGARHSGRMAGSIGDAGCFSFYPTKNLGAIGDGGAIVCKSADIAEKLRAQREYGWDKARVSRQTGINSRLDELQAAILRIKLRHLEADTRRRETIATAYEAGLAGAGVTTPFVRAGSRHAYHQYVVRAPARDALAEFLAARKIGTAVHYRLPVHRNPGYESLVRKAGSLSESETAADTVLSLPMYPELPDDVPARVIEGIRAFRA
jgi:dTDP-4-amino-4,6-dideoxygalactose transaminase